MFDLELRVEVMRGCIFLLAIHTLVMVITKMTLKLCAPANTTKIVSI